MYYSIERNICLVFAKKLSYPTNIKEEHKMKVIVQVFGLFLFIHLSLVASGSVPDCKCNNFINEHGFGMCQKKDGSYGGAYSCYVDRPSSCDDLHESFTNPEFQISAEACQTLEYVVLKVNELCDEQNIIDDKNECIEAAISTGNDKPYVPPIVKESYLSRYPSGCYLEYYAGHSNVWFNSYTGNERRSDAAPICRINIPEECIDHDPDCPNHAHLCNTDPEIPLYCPKTCGNCDECSNYCDTHDCAWKCPVNKDYSSCGYDFVALYCAKACGMCKEHPTTTPGQY